MNTSNVGPRMGNVVSYSVVQVVGDFVGILDSNHFGEFRIKRLKPHVGFIRPIGEALFNAEHQIVVYIGILFLNQWFYDVINQSAEHESLGSASHHDRY